MAIDLWVEKFRPKTLDEYVWRDTNQRKLIEEWLAAGVLPQHFLFSGLSGTGKTSLVGLILNLLQVPKGDILWLNASRERLIDVVQDKIVNFAQTWPLGIMKYIVLDEADAMSPLAQRLLRGEMETYADVTRFVLTVNYPEKIIPAIHSRVQTLVFQTLDQTEFATRLAEILIQEGIEFDIDVMMEYVAVTYPDLRKCINSVQGNCLNKVLQPIPTEEVGAKDYLLEMVNLFKAEQYLEARKLIVAQATLEEYPDIFRFMYRHLELWGDTQDLQDEALLIIRRAVLNNDSMVSDKEINLSACLVELTRLRK